MEDKPTTEEKPKRKKKSPYVEKVVDIDSSFDVLETLLNDLLKMMGIVVIDKATYQKTAQSKIDTKLFKSEDEKRLWQIRQINHFRGNAVQGAIRSLKNEFKIKEEKTKKIDTAVLLMETINKNLSVLPKNAKNATSSRDRELNETQEILDEKERILSAQLASGVKADLKDDKTPKRMKEISIIREGAIHSNIQAITALEEIIEALEELEGASGLEALAKSYYRRYSHLVKPVGMAFGAMFALIIVALIYKTISPYLTPPPKKEAKLKEKPKEPKPEKKQELVEEGKKPEKPKKRQLTPDEQFKELLLNKKFVPSCTNSYVILVGRNLSNKLARRDAIQFLKKKNIATEGKNAVQVIQVRDEVELAAALLNGALNSPYCVEGKLFHPIEFGYDLGRFPVYLSSKVDPKSLDAQFLIKEQLTFAKRKMRRTRAYYLPKLYLEKKKKGEEESNQVEEEYRKAVKEYLLNYRRAKLVAKEKNPELLGNAPKKK